MGVTIFAIIACAWSGLAVIELYKKQYTPGIFHLGLTLFNLVMIYLYSI